MRASLLAVSDESPELHREHAPKDSHRARGVKTPWNLAEATVRSRNQRCGGRSPYRTCSREYFNLQVGIGSTLRIGLAAAVITL